MAGGSRGLLAFWMGGAGANPASSQSGVRSMLAPWMGGAGSPSAGQQAGMRGVMAFWMGGAAYGSAPVVGPPHPAGGGYAMPRPPRVRDDEEELLWLVAAIASELLM